MGRPDTGLLVVADFDWQIATQAGDPTAVRATGTALAHNPLPIVVPCHRVLRTGGQLGSYLGGAAARARLLELEQTAHSAGGRTNVAV
jgi:O-6-methylguanine DNA methyltransferase